jgi:tyrosine-protein kinase Etk/Wzc
MADFKVNTPNSERRSDDILDLKKIFSRIIQNWAWFILSIFITVVIALVYIKYASPVYQIRARVLINDDKEKGGLGAAMGGSGMSDFGGLLGGKSSVDNEVEVLKTRFIMEQVVRRMQLNIVYNHVDGFKTTEMYKAPFKLTILKAVDTIKFTKISIDKLPGNKINISFGDINKSVRWGERFPVKNLGVVQLEPESGVPMPEGEYSVFVSSIDQKVSEMTNRLVVALTNKQVTVIDLDLTYPITRKGEEILQTLIHQYITLNIDDKNEVADSTIKFIQNRLSYIGGELGGLEGNIQTFRQKNQLADMTAQSKLIVENSGQYINDLAKTEIQITVLNELETYLKDETKNKRILPSSLTPNDVVFSNAMDRYNSLLIERDKQLMSETELSPFVQNIDKQISNLRADIMSNIRNSKNTFLVTRDKLRKQINQVDNKMQEVPEIEKNYLVLARQQKIKEQLYIFLMEKAEETAISKTSNIAVGKTIDPPKASYAPISPKKYIILFISLLAGAIIPLAIILLRIAIDNKVSTKEDIQYNTDVPIIGEISHNTTVDNLVVANNGRSAISEQFRALRTNLTFYLKSPEQKIILFTSSVSGEGKSFTAINLGNILAITGKRVVLMELDLRKPGLSVKLNVENSRGFSNFTIDTKLTPADIIKPLSINPNLFLIGSGPIPPNPAETLMSVRTIELFEDLKKQFDYIIIDAPPVGIITDAQLLADQADVSIYMMRAGFTLKEHIKIVDDLYRTNKMRNLSIVVNDIKSKSYGYGYGYGSYGEGKEMTFMEKVLDKFKTKS